MPQPVIHDNDGHVDDLLSTMLLWLAPETELLAVTIADGDCFVEPAFESLLKIATFLDLEGPEIGYSEDKIPYPFPDSWRQESYVVNELPMLNSNPLRKIYQSGKGRKSQAVIADCLSNSRSPVTIVATGPLTNVAPIFE